MDVQTLISSPPGRGGTVATQNASAGHALVGDVAPRQPKGALIDVDRRRDVFDGEHRVAESHLPPPNVRAGRRWYATGYRHGDPTSVSGQAREASAVLISFWFA